MLSDKEFFLKLKRYIEDAEHKIDGEWGHCRSVEQLISDGAMPDLYFQVLQRITSVAPPEPVWTEGICGDGAAILKDGVMQPIEDVIAALNATSLAQPEWPVQDDKTLRSIRETTPRYRMSVIVRTNDSAIDTRMIVIWKALDLSNEILESISLPERLPMTDKQIRLDEGKSAVYHKIRFMTPISDPCESVRMAVIQALSEASEGYASPKKITENGRVVWDSDSQDLDDFAESIGINPDDF